MVSSAFRYSSRQENINLCIGSLFGRSPVKGDVGIEIEVEGNFFPKQDEDGRAHKAIPKEWGYHHDGSLRGADNAEYVLKKPLTFEEVPAAVNNLWQMFHDFGSVLDVSNRTSVHVHLNAQNFFLNRLASFCALYMSVEEILTEWCGQHRVGNLFCLRSKDAPAIVEVLKEFLLEKRMGRSPFPDSFHYAGLNLQALTKFGSIEVRTMRGAIKAEEVIQWVEILQHIYDLSEKFEDPREIVQNFSGRDVTEYAEMVLGKHCNQILTEVSFDADRIRTSLYEGIRYAQDLCYCRDWSEYKPTKLAPDPFRRSATKVLQSMSNENGPPAEYTTQGAPPPPSAWAYAPINLGLSTTVGTISHTQLQQYYNSVHSPQPVATSPTDEDVNNMSPAEFEEYMGLTHNDDPEPEEDITLW